MEKKLIQGKDYYFNKQGLMVFTAHFLLERGYCCKSGCEHCPYGFKKENEPQSLKKGDNKKA